MSADQADIRCSFCGLPYTRAEFVIRGPGNILICADCVQRCNEIVRARKRASKRKGPTPERRSTRDISRSATEISADADKSSPKAEINNDRALELVVDAYQTIAYLGKLPLDKINEPRLFDKYGSQADFVRELWAQANAVSSFAVASGLISPEQAGQIIRDFLDQYPDAPTGSPDNVY